MIVVWLKFLHAGSIAIWAAGLICLPALYLQRTNVGDGDALIRLQRFVRFAYVGLISPAAYVAVATGIGLIFARETFEAWFTLKLVFVGAMVAIHILTGRMVVRLFENGGAYPVWRFIAATATTVLVVLAILFLVLGKPSLDFGVLPNGYMRPGALGEIVLDFIPWTRP